MKAHLTKGDITELAGNRWSPKGDWTLWYNLTLNKCWQISIHEHFWQDIVPSGCGQSWEWATDSLQHTYRFLPPWLQFMITNQFPLTCPIFHCSIFVSVPLSGITSSEHLSAPFTKLLFCWKWEYKAMQFCRTKEKKEVLPRDSSTDGLHFSNRTPLWGVLPISIFTFYSQMRLPLSWSCIQVFSIGGWEKKVNAFDVMRVRWRIWGCTLPTCKLLSQVL